MKPNVEHPPREEREPRHPAVRTSRKPNGAKPAPRLEVVHIDRPKLELVRRPPPHHELPVLYRKREHDVELVARVRPDVILDPRRRSRTNLLITNRIPIRTNQPQRTSASGAAQRDVADWCTKMIRREGHPNPAATSAGR